MRFVQFLFFRHALVQRKLSFCYIDAGFHTLMGWIKMHYFRGLL